MDGELGIPWISIYGLGFSLPWGSTYLIPITAPKGEYEEEESPTLIVAGHVTQTIKEEVSGLRVSRGWCPALSS